MMENKHIVVLDAISFNGGSKVATNTLLTTISQPNQRVTVITNDPTSWDSKFQQLALHESDWLATKDHGLLYFLRHFIIALHILVVRIAYGKVDVVIGASTPGVDLSVYLARYFMGYRIIQLIHGPVACSGTIARCLIRVHFVFYLPSSINSLAKCLAKKLNTTDIKKVLRGYRFKPLNIGICKRAWPTQCQYHTPQILWAASLLKWKGLDFFINSISAIPVAIRPVTEICYIRPKTTAQSISKAPVILPKFYWHLQPSDLNTIRSNCNIFVSTSQNEPFGLSILEALAAGLCVIIPQDNAYWDRTLCDDVNCIKYHANDLHDLAEKVLELTNNPKHIKRIGQCGQQLSAQYKASKTYQKIRNIVMQ